MSCLSRFEPALSKSIKHILHAATEAFVLKTNHSETIGFHSPKSVIGKNCALKETDMEPENQWFHKDFASLPRSAEAKQSKQAAHIKNLPTLAVDSSSTSL